MPITVWARIPASCGVHQLYLLKVKALINSTSLVATATEIRLCTSAAVLKQSLENLQSVSINGCKHINELPVSVWRQKCLFILLVHYLVLLRTNVARCTLEVNLLR